MTHIRGRSTEAKHPGPGTRLRYHQQHNRKSPGTRIGLLPCMITPMPFPPGRRIFEVVHRTECLPQRPNERAFASRRARQLVELGLVGGTVETCWSCLRPLYLVQHLSFLVNTPLNTSSDDLPYLRDHKVMTPLGAPAA